MSAAGSSPTGAAGERGAEVPGRRAMERIVPWIVSLWIHAAIVALGFLLTWSVVKLSQEREPVVVTAQFDALRYDPLASLQPPQASADAATGAAASVSLESLREELRTRIAAAAGPPDIPLAPGPAPAPGEFTAAAPGEFTAAAPGEFTAAGGGSATFVGLTSTNARRIAYVIDASGSMIGALPVVIGELGRSLAMLSPRQSYTVVFFQRNQALGVPPAERLVPATPEARGRTMEWIREHVAPAGRSNPLEALRQALRLRPDVIFLLSENITGSGEFEIDQEDLLQLLEGLNPADRRSGARATRINCVQFLDPDPLDTLRRIAERHGGPDGYKFLGRAELGLEAP